MTKSRARREPRLRGARMSARRRTGARRRRRLARLARGRDGHARRPAGSRPAARRGRAPARPRAARPRLCEAITARRRRDVPSGTVGGRIAWANTPRSMREPRRSRIALRGVADDERHDLRRRARDVEALAGQLVAQGVGVGLQLARRAAGCSASSSSAASAPATAGGGGAVEKMNGRARVDQAAAPAPASHGGERAVGAERLAERADDDVDLVLEAGLGDGAAAARARGSRSPCASSTTTPHAVAAGELDDLGERRDVAVHREDRVGDDQRAAARRPRAAPHARCSTSPWR